MITFQTDSKQKRRYFSIELKIWQIDKKWRDKMNYRNTNSCITFLFYLVSWRNQKKLPNFNRVFALKLIEIKRKLRNKLRKIYEICEIDVFISRHLYQKNLNTEEIKYKGFPGTTITVNQDYNIASRSPQKNVM
jgi:hypothetical protein